jgi:hypothetical protein
MYTCIPIVCAMWSSLQVNNTSKCVKDARNCRLQNILCIVSICGGKHSTSRRSYIYTSLFSYHILFSYRNFLTVNCFVSLLRALFAMLLQKD